jgi:hypothetical protein
VQLDGVKAVLLIHWLMQGPLKAAIASEKVGFRAWFRAMEGLIEWYLYTHDGRTHCFGLRQLRQHEGLSFRLNDASTAVNGLYQFYRGTCRRAALLNDNWELEAEAAKALKECWPRGDTVTQVLTAAVKRSAQKATPLFEPKAVLMNCQMLRDVLHKVFTSVSLEGVLRKYLLGSPAQIAFANHCGNVLEISGNARIEELQRRMSRPKDGAAMLIPHLQEVRRCEKFLSLLQDGFDLLRVSPGLTVEKVAQVMQPYKAAHVRIADDFGALLDAAPGQRSDHFSVIANALNGGSHADFLNAILLHHGRLMEDRGAQPLVSIEGHKLVCAAESERTHNDVTSSLSQGGTWSNGYYLEAAGTMHSQLFGSQA